MLVATSWTKVAVTVVFAEIVRVQVRMPLHPPPDHPPKVEPAAAAAVRMTCVFTRKLALQVVPQLIPDGVLVTVPEPLPITLTERVGWTWTNSGLYPLSAKIAQAVA